MTISGGQADLNYAHDPAGDGFYRLVLTVDGKEATARVEIKEEATRE
jgi:hypothetical protein